MKAVPAVGSEVAPHRVLSSRLRVVAGVLVGLLTAGLATFVRAAKPPPTASATLVSGSMSEAIAPIESSSPLSRDAPIDLVELRRREVSAHHAAIEQHMREPGDPLWAPASEKSLRVLLATIPTHTKFRVTSVDCRNISCVAEVSFASYAIAQKTWHSILEAINPLGCGTQITLEDPKSQAKSYDLSVVYDCAEARRRASEQAARSPSSADSSTNNSH